MGFYQNTCKPEGLGGKLMTQLMNGGHHAKLAEWGFSFLTVPANANILDAGCGGGANLARWLAQCPNGQVTGLDYSPVSVATAKKYNRQAIADGRCQAGVSPLCGPRFRTGSRCTGTVRSGPWPGAGCRGPRPR